MRRVLVDNDEAFGGLRDNIRLVNLRAGSAQRKFICMRLGCGRRLGAR